MPVLLQHRVRRPNGHVVFTDRDGHQEEHQTLRCAHCQHVWMVEPGSGHRRGWCMSCAAPTCGRAGCDTCVPFEKAIEAEERRDRLYASARAAIGR